MNDSEIIKALECCSLSDCMADCIRLKCPFFIKKDFNRGCGLKDEYNGKRKLYKYALDLINRQQAEIERLNIELKAMRGAANSWKAEVQRICKKEFDNIEIDIEAVKSEAVRKFAEKLAIKLAANYSDKYCHWIDDTIYELVEEMGCNDEL